ncbi:MAG: hypothetical protein ACRDUV_17505 [Pseudonocardiaceae bacterium]
MSVGETIAAGAGLDDVPSEGELVDDGGLEVAPAISADRLGELAFVGGLDQLVDQLGGQCVADPKALLCRGGAERDKQVCLPRAVPPLHSGGILQGTGIDADSGHDRPTAGSACVTPRRTGFPASSRAGIWTAA